MGHTGPDQGSHLHAVTSDPWVTIGRGPAGVQVKNMANSHVMNDPPDLRDGSGREEAGGEPARRGL